uniref:Listerin E3 ubiquitin protein ligase 1 n=1 Tax=Sphaerodactylus townsendi TaxID=933632 RepID=A0ACB8FHJ2_9SAUR
MNRKKRPKGRLPPLSSRPAEDSSRRVTQRRAAGPGQERRLSSLRRLGHHSFRSRPGNVVILSRGRGRARFLFDLDIAVAIAMGGKNKQRTKGNVRPSSSGRAAELLAKERGTVPGFIGFGSSSDLGYVPAVQGAEEIDSLVDADFRMVLRKLSKRDVITKLKAMQEFGTMCKERETETVKGVLPYWSRIYCKISLDHDRRVREATQQAFEHLILKVKKNLAPHLKNLMGHWLIAQCDTYSPAASAATAAFEKAFPPSKQPEALVFCKDEILNVLQDHLLKETPNTLSDPQTVPEEEREAKFFRILTCSLLALKKLLCLLPSSENCLLEEKLKPLLSQNKFWKYGKHSNPQVRSAFFEVISALCQYAPESVKADASRACPAVLLSIDDSDAIVCPALWEAVLHVLATIEDCWIHVNVKKGVLPKLWILLQEGGRGLATIIYPNLLPFISKVPDDVIEPKLDFYRTFFTSMIQGMLTERATASRSECSAILSAFMECFRFTILQNGGEGGGIRIQEMLLNEQLIPLIDMVIKEPRLQNGPLFYEVADLLSSWETRTDSSSCEETTLTFQRMLSNFWDGLSKVCVVHVDVIDADEKALAAVSCLLQILQNPENKMKPSKRKAVKIRFSEEVEAGNSTENEKDVNLRSSNKPGTIFHAQDLSPLRKEPLEDLVCTLAELSIVYTGAQRSDQHLKFLSALLSSFASQRVFQVLLGSRNNIQEAVKPQYENPSLQFLYENVIDWLKEDWRKETDFLVDILYSVLHCCSSTTEKENILNGLTKMDLRWKILLQIIQKLGDMHKESTFLRRSAFWVKNQLQSTVMDIKSLQVLISAVSDLLTALLEADEVSAYILKDYIEWLTPSTSEWEKMRESLSTEWLKKPLLEGRLSMNCQISGTDLGLCVTDKLPSYLWTTALLSKVTLLILGKGVFESQDMERSKLESIIAEQLYALQWIEELANPSCLLLEFLHDLQAMNVSLEKLSVLSNIPCLLQILFNSNLKEASSQLLGFNTEMIRFLSLLLKSPSSLLDSEWDFVMCSMLAWLETTSESQAVFSIALVQVFVCVSCDLATALSVWFQAVTSENTEKLPPNLLSEWQEFFSEGIHSLLLPLMVKITRDTKNASEISFQNSVLKSLGEALMFVSKDQLLNHKLPAKFVASQKTNLPDEVQTLLNTLSPLLLFRARSIQITVYHMLNKLMSDLPEFDNKDLRSYGDEEEELSLSPPAALMTILVTQEDLLENILECIPVGEFAVIQPLSEEFCLVLGYLLTWKLILTFFKAASSQLRALYSQYLRRTKSLNKLLYHLFRLMPENPAFPGSTAEFLNKDTKTYFTEGLNLDIKDTSMLSSEIPHLACSVYCMTLKDLPAMVRLWWNSCEKRVFSIVDKFTSKYVSNILSSQEISSVQTSTQLFNGMMVKARSATREVIATYSVDDIFIELIIQLPPNYPLGSIAVESGKRVGVAVQQWRNWMLQLSTYLTHQNGSIMEGLALWKNNVDKRFEGVEDCMICFSVIHGSNYSLPKKACRTCKKKFHSACLYKWFTSSNKSTCPLCRETFF